MKLLHHFGDPLWALGDKSSPDPSFTLARVFPQANNHYLTPHPIDACST